MSERKRRETLFTVKDRSVVTRACLHEGRWEGTRKKRLIRFEYVKDAPDGAKILWGIVINRAWHNGTAATVFDAMQDVENKAERFPLEFREAKMEAECAKD